MCSVGPGKKRVGCLSGHWRGELSLFRLAGVVGENDDPAVGKSSCRRDKEVYGRSKTVTLVQNSEINYKVIKTEAILLVLLTPLLLLSIYVYVTYNGLIGFS